MPDATGIGHPAVQHVFAQTGGTSVAFGGTSDLRRATITVLLDREQDVTTEQFKGEIRPLLREIPDARVSTQGEQSLEGVDEDAAASRGLINYLMRARHGSPFEHNSMTFYVQAPIFVFREFMRHRIASYNEESGRYREL